MDIVKRKRGRPQVANKLVMVGVYLREDTWQRLELLASRKDYSSGGTFARKIITDYLDAHAQEAEK